MREIVLDTETTGLDPKAGHRVVEIGCVELLNHMPTGEVFHIYLNPERDMPAEALAVHGLSEEFLADKPKFAEIVSDFEAFLGDAKLVIHNARFDIGFLNAELARLDRPQIPMSQSIDTVAMARRKYPGAQASLDALCRRFEIDSSARTYHGALLDAELLSAVYLELIGGREPGLELAAEARRAGDAKIDRVRRAPRPHSASEDELAAHAKFIAGIPNALWSGANKAPD